MNKVKMKDTLPYLLNDVFTIGKEGITRERLPDGGILCRNVPFARTGTMEYGISELGGQMDTNGDHIDSPNGIITVHRDGDLLFSQPVIESFEASPITLQHPPVFVNPDNMNEYTQGTIRNIRQGEDALNNYLLADLVIRGRDALNAVESKRLQEVSPGYESEYEPIEGKPGHYKQTSMIGNHLAIVDRGRGGRGVRIGDNHNFQRKKRMGFKPLKWAEKALNAIAANDAESLGNAIREGASEVPDQDTNTRQEPIPPKIMPKDKEEGEGNTENGQTMQKQILDAITGLGGKIDALVNALTNTAKTSDDNGQQNNGNPSSENSNQSVSEPSTVGDDNIEEKKVEKTVEDEVSALVEEGKQAPIGDAAFVYLRQNTLANAELLSPGIKTGAIDMKAKKADQYKMINATRIAALERGLKGENGDIIRQFIGNKPPRNMTSDALFTAFQAAGTAVKYNNNNNNNTGGSMSARSVVGNSEITLAHINNINHEFWNKKQG